MHRYFTHWNLMSLYWALWLVAGFGVPEAIALLSGHSENTLSDNVWHVVGLEPGHPWTFLHFLIAALMVWLTFHFVLGWFR